LKPPPPPLPKEGKNVKKYENFYEKKKKGIEIVSKRKTSVKLINQ